MKTITLLSFVLLFGLYSCKKCKICTTVTEYREKGKTKVIQTTSSSVELCGGDIKEVDGKTIDVESTSSGITIVGTSKTTCQ